MNRFFYYKVDHILFWVLTVFFHGYTRLSWIGKAGIAQFILELIVRNGLMACAIYITLLYSIPCLTDGKIWQGALGIIFSVLFYVIVKNGHDAYFYGEVLGDKEKRDFFYNTFYNFSIVLFYLAFAATLFLSKQWFIQRDQLRKMEIEKLNTELDYLRAQMNPHFLFNSINTIYFQIDKLNKDARETLSKFSDMLRYQLYECNGHEIEIEKEIKYLQSYVDLQRLRMNENYHVTFQTDDSINNYKVPPLLFIPLIENAFKHVSHFTHRKNEIHIQLTKSNDNLILEVTNTKEAYPKETNASGGIGLKNINRRLELIYPNRYKLQINNLTDHFKIHLSIPIA